MGGFLAGPLSCANWNLEMLVFVERGKRENSEKNPRSMARTNNKLNPRLATGRNPTRATLVGGKRSHHCAIPGPLLYLPVCFKDLQSVRSWLFSRGCSIWLTFGFLVTVSGFRRSVGLLVHGMTWYPWCLHVSLPRDIARYFGSLETVMNMI